MHAEWQTKEKEEENSAFLQKYWQVIPQVKTRVVSYTAAKFFTPKTYIQVYW